MPLFDIDFDNLVWLNLPVRLRQPIQNAWLKAVTAPVKYLYELFLTNRGNNIYLLSHNSQVCYLEAALNDTFDTTDRRVYITDSAISMPDYLYLQTESSPVWVGTVAEYGTTLYLDPLPLYTITETVTETGFVVHVPTVVSFDRNMMVALINQYRLPGKNAFSIVTF